MVEDSPPVSLNFENPPWGGPLVRTPWLCGYRPVRIETREGQQSGLVTNMFSKVTPWLAKSLSIRVMTPSDFASRSSRTMSTMFGLGGLAVDSPLEHPASKTKAIATAIATERRSTLVQSSTTIRYPRKSGAIYSCHDDDISVSRVLAGRTGRIGYSTE